MTCPGDTTLVDYLGGHLDDTRAAAVEAHIDGCASCTAVLAEAARLPEDSSLVDVTARGARLGRFIVEDQLGAGAMGVVMRAHDPELDRQVAIKIVTPDSSDRAGAPLLRERLRREARAMAQLNHPNVITVHEVGPHGELLYVVMELCEGGSLRNWLRDGSRSAGDILSVFEQAAAGLAAAHAAGLVHRDFKPDNVLLTEDGTVKVADFGLVRSHSQRGDTLTRSGALMGSPAYMAPEQHLSLPVGPAADQFSFCVALYEALFGARPFAGNSYVELAMNVVDGRMVPPPRREGVPAHVWAVLERGLARQPEHRWPSMTELARALASPSVAVPRSRGRGRGLAVAGVVATVALAGAIGFSLRGASSTTASSSTTPVPSTDDQVSARALADSKRQAAAVMKQMKALQRNLPGPMSTDDVNVIVAEAAGMAYQRPPAQWWKRMMPCPGTAALKQSLAPRAIWCERAGVKHGFYTRWHDEKIKAEEGGYNYGRRMGVWSTWHPNGRLASEAGYLLDRPRTPLRRWDQTGKPLRSNRQGTRAPP